MKTRYTVLFALLALLLLPALMFGQEQPAERGSIELGVRQVWGSVYGRPDLSFKPSLLDSKVNEYGDIRNGFYVKNLNATLDNLLGSNNFLDLQSRSAVYKDQSFLATFGQYGRYKAQFRYDQSPHTYTDTARTLFTQNTPGVFTFPSALRTTLQGTTAANIPGVVNGLVPSFNFITPSTTRKAGTGSFDMKGTEDWSFSFLFARETQTGSRPIGYVLNSSPSASASSGAGVELPEPIDYNTNTIKAETEYGKKNWGVQFGYIGSLFENNISRVVFDNAFNTVDLAGKPTTGQAALYPSNSAHNLNFAGAFDPNKYVHLSASVSPGWLRQNDSFLPYTSSAPLLAQTAALPATGLKGERQTLAMNYTFVSRPSKSLELSATYRQYDYNNNDPILAFTPVQGDAGTPNLAAPVENTAYSFFKKNVEVAGTWFFTRKSSAKVGYEWEAIDRDHRDVNHTAENSVFASVDLVPHKTVQMRLSYRHSDRQPDVYENESEELMPALRRFDENARMRDRADASVSYSPLDKLTLSASYGTTQDNYNLRDNSLNGIAYGFLAGGSAMPYYSYGLLKDINYNYGFGVDYAATSTVSVFGEYMREKYKDSMVSRQRNVNTIAGVEVFDAASDSPGNDWTSADRNIIDTYSTGVDLYLSKKIYITTYYSLSAGNGLNASTALGNASMFASGGPFFVPAQGAVPAAKFLVTTVLNFPETTTRLHEVGAVIKFKLTKNLMPKFEYRMQQYDSKDYQTSMMDPYLGITNPGGAAFYPYLNVFDASAARFLFLGADQPSYRVHTATASLEYHF
jgi:MtrB/PioB family decaheme-associated outer membrane protein